MSQLITEQMRDDWAEVLDTPVKGTNFGRRDIMIRLLENQKQWIKSNTQLINEMSNASVNQQNSSVATYAPILIDMVKRTVPNLVALDFFGTQPLSTPDGLIFAMRVRANTQDGKELFVDEPDSAFSGLGEQAGDPSMQDQAADKVGTGMSLADAQALGVTKEWSKIGVSIEKQQVTTTTRALYADYTHELRQDMMAVHGQDVDAILSDAMVVEMLAEQNREFIRTMNKAAKAGGKDNTGAFSLENDTDGRWFLERVKYAMFQIEMDANKIAKDTRRGKGNRLICSANFASALAMSGLLDYNLSNLDGNKNLQVDVTGQTFAGVLSNGMRVYIDPYAELEYYNIAYKGASELDAGIFYAPYTPLELAKTVGETSFQPRMGIKQRSGIVANPFYAQNADGTPVTGKGLGFRENGYFRIALVKDLV